MRKVIFLMGLLGGFFAVLADGVIIPRPPYPVPKPYLELKAHKVYIEINDSIARVEVDETFFNQHRFAVEGDYIFPLPKGVMPSKFSLIVGGKRIEGKVLEKEEARRIYESIVRRLKDPALLEYYNNNLFRARIFPIPPGKTRRIIIRYEYELDRKGDYFVLHYPLKIEGISPKPIEDVLIKFSIKSSLPVKQVFSPSHRIDIYIKGTSATGAFEAKNYRPDKDFLLYFSRSQKDYFLSLLTYKKKRKDGYFLLGISTPSFPEKKKVLPKDVIFVIDVSGSMSGEKIEQAKKGLKFFIEHLNPRDRFTIIAFSTDLNVFKGRLEKATGSAKNKAKKFVEKLEALGGTNIYDALRKAFEISAREGGKSYIIFLTDGQPTVGQTDEKSITELVRQSLKEEKVFVFGVGYDVNTVLLDEIASIGCGAVEYVEPNSNLELVLTSFFTKIKYPALEKIKLEFKGIDVSKLHPSKIPALFYGQTVMVAGRYSGSAKATVILKGVSGNKTLVRKKRFFFPKENKEFDFVPLIWARKRVSYLLSQIRFHGETKELVDEIVKLGKEFGIVTPYTSYLITEEEKARYALAASPQAVRNIKTGKLAFGIARSIQKMQKEIAFEENEIKSIKRIADRVFYLRNGIFVDSLYRKGMKTITVKFASNEFFKLLKKYPDFAKFFSVGEQVIVVIDNVAYKIVKK